VTGRPPGPGTDPAVRLRRAAGQLKRATNFIETICIDEGVPMPLEVLKAAATIRTWCRTLGVTDPAPSRVMELLAQSARPARPRRRDAWRRTSR
jgi:hypothetical protein